MLTFSPTTKFRKDVKRAMRRGYDMRLLEAVVTMLLNEEPLDIRYKDHPLTGNYLGFRECHILPDWLLIYAVNKSKLVLVASRTGTHADLFDE